jgi:hypothetical protein
MEPAQLPHDANVAIERPLAATFCAPNALELQTVPGPTDDEDEDDDDDDGRGGDEGNIEPDDDEGYGDDDDDDDEEEPWQVRAAARPRPLDRAVVRRVASLTRIEACALPTGGAGNAKAHADPSGP